MTEFQPDELICETLGDDVCLTCGQFLQPLYENNGFDEPGADHQEFIGYKKCQHDEEVLE